MIPNLRKKIYDRRIAGDSYDDIAFDYGLEREDCKIHYNLYSKMLFRIGMRKCPQDGKERTVYLRSEVYQRINKGESYEEVAELLGLKVHECHTHYEREQSRIKKTNITNSAKRSCTANWKDLRKIIRLELKGFKNASHAMLCKSNIRAETMRFKYQPKSQI